MGTYAVAIYFRPKKEENLSLLEKILKNKKVIAFNNKQMILYLQNFEGFFELIKELNIQIKKIMYNEKEIVPVGVSIQGNYIVSNNEKLKGKFAIRELIKLLKNNKIEIKDYNFVSFGDKYGYTLNITLASSSISIHTWPEANSIQIDIYPCHIFKGMFNDLKETILKQFEYTNRILSLIKNFYGVKEKMGENIDVRWILKPNREGIWKEINY